MKVLNYIDIGVKEGARLVCGGKKLKEGDYGKGFFIEPTVFEARHGLRITKEEIFGPVLSVIKIGSYEEAIHVANDVDYGLSSAALRGLRALHYAATACRRRAWRAPRSRARWPGRNGGRRRADEGDRGALASKPVMEGKGVLFKKFADVDVFDIEVNTHDPDELVRVTAAISPTFGGINLEDIKAPECFYVEETLKEMLDIPVFHDDQHGTAIISGAALLNALELVGKPIDQVKITISGAGASAISCAELMIRLGVTRSNVTLVDTRGVVYKGRTEGMNKYKDRLAVDTDARTLTDAMRGADVFYGLSIANILTPEMVK